MGKLSCKAEITVFLSLILSVVLWCSLILIEGVRIVNLDYMAQSMIEAGTFSLLGDYNRILLDKYDVFFLDASYNSAQLSETKIKEKLNEYINYNNSSLFNNNILKQNLEEVLVENMGVITEDCGKLFRKQAINSTDQNIGMNILKDILKNLDRDTDNNEQMLDEYKKKSEEFEMELANSDEDDKELKKICDDGRMKDLKEIKALDILNLVISDKEGLSTASINESTLLSSRIEYDLNIKADDDSLEKVLFGEYILNHFDTYVDVRNESKDKQKLAYETEYIISGKMSDLDCLRDVIKRILKIREISNFIFLIKDAKSLQESNALATTIAGFTGNPVVIKGVQAVILFTWSYGESLLDVRYLLDGEKIPIIKNSQNFNCDLSMLFNMFKGEHIENKSTEGLDYEGYLRLLLFMEDTNKKTINCMNILEKNIRLSLGYENFCLNNCIENIEISAVFKSKSIFVENSFDYVYSKRKYASYSEFGG